MTFWEKYQELCTQHNTSPNAVAAILKFSNATCTKWKKGSVPSSESAVKIAEYFGVSTDYLLGNETSFDRKSIERCDFMTENFNPDVIIDNIDLLCNQHGISINKMLSECKLNKSIVDNMKRGSVPSVDKLQIISKYFNCSLDFLVGNDSPDHTPTDDDIKFALFDGAEGITDEMYDEVKQFAAFVKERESAKRKEKK